MSLAERMVDLLWRARWLLLALLVPLIALSVLGARQVGVDNAVEVWFVDGDPALVAYGRFQETFGNDEVVVFAVHVPDGIYDRAGIERIEAVSRAASDTPGIAEVTSLATASHARLDETIALAPGEAAPLVVASVLDAAVRADPAALRARVEEDPLLRGRLVSEDGRTAVVLARMETMDDMDSRRDAVLSDLEGRVRAAAGEVPSAGIGVVYSALNRASTRDVAVLGALSYALIVGLLWILLGRVGAVLAALVVIGLTTLVTMGLYGGTGRDLNMVTMALPTLLFIMCIEDVVHMLHGVAGRTETSRRERTVRGIGSVLWPCLFTTLTTAAGFAALGTARMQVVRDLGWFGAFGVLAAFALSIVVLLPALRWVAVEPRARSASPLERALSWIADLAIARRFEVLGLSAAIALAAAWGISRIEADTWSIDFFYEAHPVRADSALVEQRYGPYVPLELVVEAPESLRNPEALGAIAAWQDRIDADPSVGGVGSVVDVVRRLNQLLGDGRAESFAVPGDEAALEQALFVYGADPDASLDGQVTDDWRRLRVTAMIPMLSAKGIGATIDRLTALTDTVEGWPEGARVVPSGYLPLYVTMMDYVVQSQINSFIAAFLAIFALIGLLFRSVRMTLFAVPSNLFPLFVTLGAMGLLGIRLDVATVTIAAIVLGLVVNDTIHFLFRFRESLHETGDHAEAVRRTMRTSGVAIAGTSLCLLLGFAVLGLAEVKSVAWFGLLTATAMAAALFGDLLLLPALLSTLKPKL